MQLGKGSKVNAKSTKFKGQQPGTKKLDIAVEQSNDLRIQQSNYYMSAANFLEILERNFRS